jgi:hypothetical protein
MTNGLNSLALAVVMFLSINLPTPTSFLAPIRKMYVVLGRKFSKRMTLSEKVQNHISTDIYAELNLIT